MTESQSLSLTDYRLVLYLVANVKRQQTLFTDKLLSTCVLYNKKFSITPHGCFVDVQWQTIRLMNPKNTDGNNIRVISRM
jgi:hypothetical protein